MCNELVALFRWFEYVISGAGDSQYGICSGCYGYRHIINYMIGLIGLDVRGCGWYVLGVCIGGVCMVCVMGVYR